MAALSMLACFVAVLLCIRTSRTDTKEDEINPSQSTSATSQHRTDSLTILMLLGLLLLTILTVWLFKHRRFRFVHETGLSMIYGLIVGAIIRYTSKPMDVSRDYVRAKIISENHSYYTDNAPTALYVSFFARNSSADPTIRQYDLGAPVDEPITEPPLERTVTFDPEIFFNVMLPVIIFEAGYSMKRRHFFRNLGAILMYAVVGTTASCLVVGGILYGTTRLMHDITFSLNDCFYFGAVISATDPVTVLALFNDLHVDVDLYAIVFGESVLNDAVAIVLSESVEVYGELSSDSFNTEALFQSVGKFLGVFTGAFAIGSLFGLSTAFLTKFTKLKDFPLLETALFFLMSYASFQAAEAAEFTGIVAVLFCGVTQAHYTYNNLSAESKDRTKKLFELANFLAENFVFLYIGVSVFTLQPLQWHLGFILSSFLAIVVGRFINIYPLSFLLNLGRSNKIRPNFQHMMMFSGLRGAVAFALAIRNTETEAHQHMASATLMIVIVTVILCGGFTTPMLQWLQIRVGVEEDAPGQMNQLASVRNQQGGGENGQQPGSTPSEKAWLVAKWYNFDTIVMKPLLTNHRPTLIETLPKCCLPIAKIFTTEEQLTQGLGGPTDHDSDTDMIIDENQLSIGGMSDHSQLDQASVSPNHQTGRKEPLQKGDGPLDKCDCGKAKPSSRKAGREKSKKDRSNNWSDNLHEECSFFCSEMFGSEVIGRKKRNAICILNRPMF
ncbi:sodium/hydrogen exchanger 9-like isoform X3 [Littorina saxatilis]|uniref:sodium/hydrogen exchanger 9-like isoform X3 n=1 Tax=Littorina saxatilis TaxID=31220 RepID=UPI0038B44D78